MTKNWGWRPRCWGFVLPNHGGFLIGELPWTRLWGVEIGIGLRPNAKDGEIRWRWHRRWHMPQFRFIRRSFASSSPVGGEWLSRRWTGRDQEIIGVVIGRLGWVWA